MDLQVKNSSFWVSESASDLSYYPTNLKKKCDICNQHTEPYGTVSASNRTATKIFFDPWADPRHEKISCEKT